LQERGAVKNRVLSFVREIARAAALIAVAALIIAPFLYAVREAQKIAEAGGQVWGVLRTHIPTGVSVILLLGWLLVVVILVMVARGWWRLFRDRWWRYRTSVGAIETVPLWWWRWASIVTAAVLLTVAVILPSVFGIRLVSLVVGIANAVRSLQVLVPLAALVAAVFLRTPLVKFVGDISLYVSADERAGAFRTRQEILEKSQELLNWLIDDASYQSVYVAGHSLGSVIAYDTINRLVNEARVVDVDGRKSRRAPNIDRLRGLLTFGSPLDKVYYFFRTKVGQREAIRAQILSSLHGFRKKASRRDYRALRFARYTVPQPQDFLWYNVYSHWDPVSGWLDFYHVDHQERLAYWTQPLRAHLAYWDDPKFYKVVRGWLEGNEAAKAKV
jgi:hypothetical protein